MTSRNTEERVVTVRWWHNMFTPCLAPRGKWSLCICIICLLIGWSTALRHPRQSIPAVLEDNKRSHVREVCMYVGGHREDCSIVRDMAWEAWRILISDCCSVMIMKTYVAPPPPPAWSTATDGWERDYGGGAVCKRRVEPKNCLR